MRTTRAGRSAFLTAAVASAVASPVIAEAPGAAAAPGADAGLIRECAEFDALEMQFLGLHNGPNEIKDDDERDLAIEPIWEAQEPIVGRICELQATTLEGLHARIRTMLLEDHGLDPIGVVENSGLTNHRLMAALLRDLAISAGALWADDGPRKRGRIDPEVFDLSYSEPGSDAELLAACSVSKRQSSGSVTSTRTRAVCRSGTRTTRRTNWVSIRPTVRGWSL